MKVWTESGKLWVQLEAKDDYVAGTPDNRLWNGDALEVYVDRTPFQALDFDNHPGHKDIETRQYIFAVKPDSKGNTITLLNKQKKSTSKASSGIEMISSGYKATVSIPLAEISPMVGTEKIIGLNFERCLRNRDTETVYNKEFFTLPPKPSCSSRLHYPLFKIEAFESKDE